jgi:hypothetical protein
MFNIFMNKEWKGGAREDWCLIYIEFYNRELVLPIFGSLKHGIGALKTKSWCFLELVL